jgi:hypothetical protein
MCLPTSPCGQRAAAALKASSTRKAYNPVKSGQRTTFRGGTSYGTPKVRMSFGRKKS